MWLTEYSALEATARNGISTPRIQGKTANMGALLVSALGRKTQRREYPGRHG